MNIERVDHFVLTVFDVEKACHFYSRVLGMEVILLENNRKALRFGNQKINLHEIGTKFALNAQNPACGSVDVCFVTSLPLTQVIDHIHSCGVEIVMGPITRAGAMGPIHSIYFRDPDGNLIEIANYGHK
jgi:catechol 2,3-dioxygenase-like lactoylglutathione lyase family enzyme